MALLQVIFIVAISSCCKLATSCRIAEMCAHCLSRAGRGVAAGNAIFSWRQRDILQRACLFVAFVVEMFRYSLVLPCMPESIEKHILFHHFWYPLVLIGTLWYCSLSLSNTAGNAIFYWWQWDILQRACLFVVFMVKKFWYSLVLTCMPESIEKHI